MTLLNFLINLLVSLHVLVSVTFSLLPLPLSVTECALAILISRLTVPLQQQEG